MSRPMIELEAPVEKAFLVAVDTGAGDGWTAQESLTELANLATTAGRGRVGVRVDVGHEPQRYESRTRAAAP